jgi:hypothetical protein
MLMVILHEDRIADPNRNCPVTEWSRVQKDGNGVWLVLWLAWLWRRNSGPIYSRGWGRWGTGVSDLFVCWADTAVYMSWGGNGVGGGCEK